MAVSRQREGVWRIESYHSKALPGYARIRETFHGTEAEARRREHLIGEAQRKYGLFPVPDGAVPLEDRDPASGNIRKAAELTIEHHWKNPENKTRAGYTLLKSVRWLEKRGKKNFEDVTSEDMEALVAWMEADNLSASTINHHLSYLSTANTFALERKPPITKAQLPIKRLPQDRVEKWWLRPEDLEKAVGWLEGRRDPLFADYIQVLCFQGFRPEECLKLHPKRSFTGLDTTEPWIVLGANRAGNKTQGSADTVALFELARPVIERAIERAEKHGWDRLFPLTQRQARDRWNMVRAMLGVSDVPTANLRALRRTFAYYANASSMPTRTLQKVLRHTSITTTEGYLNLAGTNEQELARGYMTALPLGQSSHITPSVSSDKDNLRDIIAAYRETGASPAEVAQFVKELMQ